MKRRLFIVAVFLLAGAVVNVAVAWGFAIRVAAPNPLTAITDQEGFYVNPHTGAQWWCQVTRVSAGHTMVVLESALVITRKVPIAYSGDVVAEMGEETTVESKLYHTWSSRKMAALYQFHPRQTRSRYLVPIESDAIPRWARNPIRMFSAGQVHTACGWPLLSFRCEEALGPALRGRTLKVYWGCLLPDAFQSLGPGRVLPYRLIAPGFAVNTLLYAVVLWLLICGPFVPRRVIRAIRVRRGLCPKCGYPTGPTGGRCPECGP